jgi:serine O-acetyltransferase
MIDSRDKLHFYIKEDREANHLNLTKDSFLHRLKNVYHRAFNLKIRFFEHLRKSEYYDYKRLHAKYLYSILFYSILFYFIRSIYHNISRKLNVEIPLNTCGYGLYIPHFSGVIINNNAQIGNYCTLLSGVVIGRGEDYKCPIIGDNVWINTGAKLFNGITIGNNCIIGANAVVNKSFPENSILAGIPAKIIKLRKVF